MTVYFNMFGALVIDWIGSYMNSCLIVTKIILQEMYAEHRGQKVTGEAI